MRLLEINIKYGARAKVSDKLLDALKEIGSETRYEVFTIEQHQIETLLKMELSKEERSFLEKQLARCKNNGVGCVDLQEGCGNG